MDSLGSRRLTSVPLRIKNLNPTDSDQPGGDIDGTLVSKPSPANARSRGQLCGQDSGRNSRSRRVGEGEEKGKEERVEAANVTEPRCCHGE